MTRYPAYKIDDKTLDDLLQTYATDFTQRAQDGLYDPITGRDEEIEQTILILLHKGRKNVMLQAPAGVGKTALCVGLAQQIAAGNVPETLKQAKLYELDLASMSAGTSGPSEFHARFLPLIQGVAERYRNPSEPRRVLFIDEIHQIMPGCVNSAYAGLSEVMKPYLTAGDIYVIGATTKDEFRQFVEPDPAMDRRFQKVELSIPNAEQTLSIMKALKPSYERFFGVEIGDDVLERIVAMTEQHLRKRNQPDKSITTLDGACARHVMHTGTHTSLSLDAVRYIVAKETGLHPDAL
tara:strand:+ start:1950 stop:2831 length:882 start_codon:yes stop_codon:yes gene_type:complete